ncbi:ribosomal protein L5 [Phanerochaete sordida]|uniref:Ribosomal protein L5 n=1 Tax=Phanerochaete sordida TaxID=48140 RepID=A0A9P3LDX3_9APHY|nr:ribosomal protein L5 [Phanerochaete sordida]
MSAAPAVQVARSAAKSNRWRAVLNARKAKALTPRKPLKRDENGLPIPHVHVIVRDTHQSRIAEHYHNTLRDDLMYMTYTHKPADSKPPRKIRLSYDPEDPYVKHRYNPPIGGSFAWTRQALPPVTYENVIELERIQLHTMVKEALQSKSHLLGALMAFRAISGLSAEQGGMRTVGGVQIVRGKKQVQGWMRRNAPVGVKVDITGPQMYDFIGSLVHFVLPRIREFNGIPMPRPSSSLFSASAASGVVSFGLPPMAMGLFPQIEYNLDAYPNNYGMHVHFITSARGEGAQNRVRQLLSGFQIPFVRA